MRLVIPTLLVMAMATASAAKPDTDDAGTLFRKRCASCHEVPDKTLATDRAWLDQIRRTT